MSEHRYQGTHEGANGEMQSKAERQEKETKALAKVNVSALPSGMLVGKTMDEQWRLATAYCRSGILPKGYDKPEKVFTAFQFCYELGLKPLTGIRQIAVVNGTPSLFGDLPLSLVQSSGKLEYIKEFFLDEKGEVISLANKNLHKFPSVAVCVTKRKGSPNEVTTAFSVQDAQTAGLWKKAGPWSSYPKRMLQMRARGQNIKDNFADVISGAAIGEYDYNLTQDFVPANNVVVSPDGRIVREVSQHEEWLKEVEPVGEDNIPSTFDALTQGETQPDVEIESPVVADLPDPIEEPEDIEPEVAEAAPKKTSKRKVAPKKDDAGEKLITFGRFSGTKLKDLSKDELTTVFFQLRSQAANLEEPDPALTETVKLVGDYLGLKAGGV